MRKYSTLILVLVPILFLLTASPGLAGPVANCKDLSVDLSAIQERPGVYLGAFAGDLPGAVSLFTLKETFPRGGEIVSLVQLTVVLPSADASFSALLDVRDTPTAGGYERTARGEITEGKGSLTGLTGHMVLIGGTNPDRTRLKAQVGIHFCLP